MKLIIPFKSDQNGLLDITPLPSLQQLPAVDRRGRCFYTVNVQVTFIYKVPQEMSLTATPDFISVIKAFYT